MVARRAADRPADPGASRVFRRRGVAAVLVLSALLMACSAPPDGDGERAGEQTDAQTSVPVEVPPRPPSTIDTIEQDVPASDHASTPGDPPPIAAPRPGPPAQLPESRARVAALARDLVDAAVDAAGEGTIVVLVVDEHGREVVAHEPDELVVPASTLKIVTAAAALTTFGPGGTFTTVVESTAPIDGDGVLRGDLVLLGGGDPVLATAEYARWVYPARPRTPLEQLADDLLDAGLVRVEGDVVGVVRGYGGPRVADGWPDRYFSDFDARYSDGLTVDAGLRTIVRYPEEDADAGDETDVPDPGDDADPGSDTDAEPAPRGDPIVLVDHTPDPALHATTELVRLLSERGVEVVGDARTGEPAGDVVGRLARVNSPPLVELLQFAVRRSDNQVTDGLFRAVGRARTGDGSFAGGARGLLQVLQRFGIGTDGVVLADGSGLSRDDRVTARMLVDLDRAMQRSRHAPTWLSLMAVMGESGTLDQRLRGSVAQGRFAGKTGTLRDVTGLVGTVHAPGPGRYHLAVIANDAGAGRWMARTLADELVVLLAGDLRGCDVGFSSGDPGTLGVAPVRVAC